MKQWLKFIHRCEIPFVAKFWRHVRTVDDICGYCKRYLRCGAFSFPLALYHAMMRYMPWLELVELNHQFHHYRINNSKRRYWLTQFDRQCTSPIRHRWFLATDTFGQISWQMYQFVHKTNSRQHLMTSLVHYLYYFFACY